MAQLPVPMPDGLLLNIAGDHNGCVSLTLSVRGPDGRFIRVELSRPQADAFLAHLVNMRRAMDLLKDCCVPPAASKNNSNPTL